MAMKRIAVLFIMVFLFSCGTDKQNVNSKTEISGNDFAKGSIMGVEYELFEIQSKYNRYITSKSITKEIADSIYSMGLKDKILYFLSNRKPNSGEDYASKIFDNFFIVYEPDSIEFTGDYKDFVKKSTTTFKRNVDKKMLNKAYVISQDFVKNRLVNPKSADFPFLDFNVIYLGDDKYGVSSYVESENSLGATVRNHYLAIIKFKGGEWNETTNWSLEDMSFE
jgi:hypothetical protein